MSNDVTQLDDIPPAPKLQPYRAVNGHTMIAGQRYNRHTGQWQETSFDARCTDDCSACCGTGEYADEPWYDDGLI